MVEQQHKGSSLKPGSSDLPLQQAAELDTVRSLLERVCDPEIPVLSINDLGILRNIAKSGDKLVITITPTYSACPAMDVIRSDIKTVLMAHGYKNIEIKTVLSPAWTTDWMTLAGREKLENYGIAPPACSSDKNGRPRCPQCRSPSTSLLSEFGSTACKSMYKCDDCYETFCYFKVL